MLVVDNEPEKEGASGASKALGRLDRRRDGVG